MNPTEPSLNLEPNILGKMYFIEITILIIVNNNKIIGIVDMILSEDNRKYPIRPNGRLIKKEKAKISKSLPLGLFFLVDKSINTKAPLPTPPGKDKPGKYGNKKNTNGFKKSELGFDSTYINLEKKTDIGRITNAILKTFSILISFLISTKSSREKIYRGKRNTKNEKNITNIKNSIIYLFKI